MLWLTDISNDFYLLSPRKCMVIKVPVNITVSNVVVVALVSLGVAYVKKIIRSERLMSGDKLRRDCCPYCRFRKCRYFENPHVSCGFDLTVFISKNATQRYLDC
uniref:Uncharacterized protein n=1 Tax=Glossina palpalis gambiensis TaxID=67801 RepID=A0A1B0BDE3_9MUSC